jgi:hypothetical protein
MKKWRLVSPEKFVEWFAHEQNPDAEAVAHLQGLLRNALIDIERVRPGRRRAENIGLSLARNLGLAKRRGRPTDGLKLTALERWEREFRAAVTSRHDPTRQ